MTTDNLNIKIPRELISLSGIPENEIEHVSIEMWVYELYSEGKISVSKAAQLLDLKVDQFLVDFRKKRMVRIGGPQTIDEAISDFDNLEVVVRDNKK
ncbi:MAG: UPF0175 family protein [Candidatus Heimdallarchaeota archaeon]|nr:UPF0175 family protein [Candidatus Heimdallarchaeota archaeon]